MQGWGAHMRDAQICGKWDRLTAETKHINWLEMKAVSLALKHFKQDVQGKVVIIRTDNTTVVSYLNKRGNQVSKPVYTNMGAAKLVQDNEHDSKSSSHSRKEECNCGQVVSREDNKKHRMVTTADGGKPNIPSMGSTSHRSICHRQEQETSNILFSSTTSKCGSSRCILSLLGRDASICIPSSNSPEQSSEENLGGELHSNFDSTELAKTAMVSDDTKAISSNSNEATGKRRSTDSRSGSNSTPRPQCIKPSSLEIVKTRKV